MVAPSPYLRHSPHPPHRPRHPFHCRMSPHLTEETSGGTALPTELVGTVVPEQILHDDEVVLLLAKPSLLFIPYTSFLFCLGALMLGVLCAQLTLYTSAFSPYSVALLTVLAC